MFEIYQLEPNASINNGLILPETNTLTLTCAAWGEWSPKEVPRCIRKYCCSYKKNHKITVFNSIFQKLFILAVNCTEIPVEAPNNDRGRYDWTADNGTHYGTLITYE